MAEKKATTKAATAKKATASKKAVAKKAVLYVNAESVGFRAGDVYQALAAADKALSIAEIAKDANISAEEAYLGIGWLFKEGKVKDENNLITLA
jgi:predicted DNA-binding transcriptional regulator